MKEKYRIFLLHITEPQEYNFDLDNEAASELTRIKSPWLVNNLDWNNENRFKAIAWLCKKKKINIEINRWDYNQNGMSDLLAQYSYHDGI